jgi:hypothetical protein
MRLGMRLKLNYDESPSLFAFKFHLRRYIEGASAVIFAASASPNGGTPQQAGPAWRMLPDYSTS